MIRVTDVAPCKQTTHCKVCSGTSRLYGVVDFNKSCEEQQGKYLDLLGVPIYYHRCDSCGLVFTEALDRWEKADYLEHIYNDRYVEVDPDYVDVRPREYASTRASSQRFWAQAAQCAISTTAAATGRCPV